MKWRTASDDTVLALGRALERDYGALHASSLARGYARESFRSRRFAHAANWMAVVKRIEVGARIRRPRRNYWLETV